MSYYYKNSFISPEPIYANVKEEFKSYFDTGAVDDTMFPIWTDWCLRKLGKATYPIIPAILHIDNYEARLPDDFYGIREAWATFYTVKEYMLASANYSQIMGDVSIDSSLRLDNPNVECDLCNECDFPDTIKAIYKTNSSVLFEIRLKGLLSPGNIDSSCPKDMYCANFNSVGADSYDIRGNKFRVTFPSGVVYILYYSLSYDDASRQVVPDVFRVKEYIGRFLKEKIIEQLLNQSTDDSFKQLQYKYELYRQKANEAFILAETELKKGDEYRQKRLIDKVLKSHRKYKIY